jgi:PDZ domain-containing protein
LFLLFYPITYSVTAPGGLTDATQTVEIIGAPEKTITGTISTTYIVYLPRMTFFQFIVGYFNPFTTIEVLRGDNLGYSNQEIMEIGWLDHYVSIEASVIVAYEAMALIDPTVHIEYVEKQLVYGKSPYLSHYEDIAFGDEFIQMVGDGGVIAVEMEDIMPNALLATDYAFTFRTAEGVDYTVTLSKNAETGRFGISLSRRYIVDMENTTPKYEHVATLIGGPSGGLLQTLYVYNQLSQTDITGGLTIAGTGTIDYDGTAGYIGGVKQKVITAYYQNVDVFFIPFHDEGYVYDNYMEALKACEELGIDPSGWLVPVATFQDVLDYLAERTGE